MGTGEGQWWRARPRWDDRRGFSRVRTGELGKALPRSEGRQVPPGAGAPGVHSEARRDGTSVGYSDGAGSGDPAGDRGRRGDLTAQYDGEFSDHSYGFREGRNAHQAVRRVEAAWEEGLRHAVDCDLKSFFDTVDHERLLARLRRKIGGGVLLRLIGRYLRAGVVLPDGSREATPCGVPQGGPLSPLLANIVLDPLDRELERRGHAFARYADDFVIVVRSAKAAMRVMASVARYVEERLKLVVN